MSELKKNQEYFIEGQGKIDDVNKNQEFDEILKNFSSENKIGEVEKRDFEKQAIDLLITKIRDIAKSYGVDPRNFDSNQVHFLFNEYFEQRKLNKVLAFDSIAGITMNEAAMREKDELSWIINLTHELFHVFSKKKYRINEEINEQERVINFKITYRAGIGFEHGKTESLRYKRFKLLNEAITQELTNLFYSRYIRKSDFFRPLIQDFDEKNSLDGKWKFPQSCASYWEGVHLFSDLCRKIKDKSQDKYGSVVEVMDDFFKIYFSDDIKKMKPLLDLVGQRCFDDLAELSTGTDLENLKKIKEFRIKYELKEDPDLIRKLNELSKEQK